VQSPTLCFSLSEELQGEIELLHFSPNIVRFLLKFFEAVQNLLTNNGTAGMTALRKVIEDNNR
jgi:hypothetical protein